MSRYRKFAYGVLWGAISVLVAGCGPDVQQKLPSPTTVAKTDGGSDADQPMTNTDGEAPATDGELSPPDPASEVQVSIVDGEGYRAIREKQLGKVVLVDYWATW